MKLLEIRPSSNLCDIELNEVFTHENGKRYILLKRDSVKAIVCRWFWYNDVFEKIGRRIGYGGGN
jgi:hypothetical protein